VDIREGFALDAARALVGRSGLDAHLREPVADALLKLYARYRALDAELLEVNPLVVDGAGEVRALDCKLALDDGARRRHPELEALAEASSRPTGTVLERKARALGLLYIELEGDVGLLANGAGLTMATMDAIVRYGGRPANFLEIGGEAYTQARPALELVLGNPRVKSLLVNFCGAFARTDVMTAGVVEALAELKPGIPVAFSIHGTGEEEAIRLVRERLGIEPYDLMDDAVRAAIATGTARSRPRAVPA
jgi:succinyl-CoA synthetase beta subunit